MQRLPYLADVLRRWLLTDPDLENRMVAARALGDLVDAEDAVPALLNALRCERCGDVLEEIADALGKHRAHAVPKLIDMLNDEDPGVCARAAWVLGQIDDEGKPVPELTRLARDRVPAISKAALDALQSIHLRRLAKAGWWG